MKARFQFSLRTMIVVMLLTGPVILFMLSCYAYYINYIERDQFDELVKLIRNTIVVTSDWSN